MNDFPMAVLFDAAARVACAALWRASWQSGLLVLALYLICRAFRRLPAAARCWLWRLALLKFVLTLFWPLAAIPLPLLQTAAQAPSLSRLLDAIPSSNQQAALRRLAPPVTNPTPKLPSTAAAIARAATESPVRSAAILKVSEPAIAGNAWAVAPAQPSRGELWLDDLATRLLHGIAALPPFLFALYLAGVAVCLIRLTHSLRQTRDFLRAHCHPLDDATARQDAIALCRRLKIARVPQLMTAPDIAASQLVAGLPCVVLLPQETSEETDRHGRLLMLAHELAHLRRGDLWWSGFSALSHTLFFFHPLLWLARREEELAREMACDALVLTTTDASPARYGALLVQVAARPRADVGGARASLGIANEIDHIKRRLIALQAVGASVSRRRVRVLVGVIGIAVVLALVPWRVVAGGASSKVRQAQPPRQVATRDGVRVPAATGVIEGRVTIVPSGLPGANCVVDVYTESCGKIFFPDEEDHSPSHAHTSDLPEGMTDAEGRFHIERVPAGTYRLIARPFCLPNLLVPPRGKEFAAVTVGAGQRVTAPDVSLTTISATVFGRIIDSRTGESVPNVVVGAGNPLWKVTDTNNEVRADSDGRYLLHVPPGTSELYLRPAIPQGNHERWLLPYRLPFLPQTAENRQRYTAGRALPAGAVPCYQSPITTTKQISARAAQALEIDFRVNAERVPLPADSLAPITGRVIGATGQPVAGAEVYIAGLSGTREPIMGLGESYVARTDGNGRFRVEGIAPHWAGTTVQFRARDSREDGAVSHPISLTLSPAKTMVAPTLRLVPGLGASIVGRAVDASGRPLASVPVHLWAGGGEPSLVSVPAITATDAQGHYRFTRIWPDMTAHVSLLRDGYSTRDVTLNGNVELVSGKQYTAPLLTPMMANATVEGTLVTAKGTPIAGADITATAVDDGVSATGLSDTQGRFHLDGLPPGKLRLFTSRTNGHFDATAGQKDVRIVAP